MRRPRTVSRFLQEAKAASKIRHANVVDITDFGEAEGCAFFVMEYLAGEDLHHLLKREKRLEWPRARAIAIQLLGGLGAAHDAGIIHRDVKPHNCFVSPHEHKPELVKVIDFGIAKVADGSEEQLTRTGAIMGTAEYMSPEQGQGLELDARADLYSVGVILYRMLTGDVPYRGGNPMAILYQHIHGELVPPSQACPEAALAPDVDALVARALAKDREDRFATAADFIAALRAVDGSGTSAFAPVATAERSRAGVWLAGGLGLALLAGGGWWWSSQTSKSGDAAVASAPEPEPPTSEPKPKPEPEPKPEPKPDPVDAPDDDAADPPAVAATTTGADASATDTGTPDTRRDAAPSVPARRSSRKLSAAFGKVTGKVRACAKQAGLFPGEKVSVEVELAPTGKVTDVDVKGAHAKAGRTCIIDAVKQAKFGEAGRVQTATHRFSI
jgi:serine/threonine-protein kinase